MKLFTKQQIYEADAETLKTQNIDALELMNRAGEQIFNWLHLRMQGAQVPIHVFCGIGNNGGDGLVVSRHLIQHGYNVKVYVVNYSDKRTENFLKNYELIKQITTDWPEVLKAENDFPTINENDIIVDALFGIGLNRPIVEWVKQLFAHLRHSKAFTLSIDIPSGLETDKVPKSENDVVWANYTLSFQAPKLVFFLPDTAKYTGNWEAIDIGLDQNYLTITPVDAELINKNGVLQFYKPRARFSNKSTYGHSVIVGGSYGKIGAALLASRAALTIGSGLLTAYLPKCGYIPFQTAFPEAMVITDENETKITAIALTTDHSAVGLGVGMGTDAETVAAVKTFLESNNKPLVIDADGLNVLAAHKEFLKLLKAQTILTPHPKELERLIGPWKDDFEKLDKAKLFAQTYDIILVIKGYNTITLYNNQLYINTTGNPGLATAGTGDVLTGTITGLLAQGYPPLQATLFGVYMHGKSADIGIEDFGYHSLKASDVIEYLPAAFLDLFKQPEPPQVENADSKSDANKK